jgi:hypothetical protein
MKQTIWSARPGAFVFTLLALGFAAASCASGPTGREEAVRRIDAMTVAELLTPEKANVPLRPEDAGEVRRKLWQKYKAEQTKDAKRMEEHKSRQLRFGSVMRYAYRKVGQKPATGYPLYIALHGGGGAPSRVNDRGWQHMMVYYLGSVKQGVYLAPRGVTNTWNLHSVGDSYPLYDRLIENMILFEDVDPNRVYLLGYSAGGDGVYQITPRMADRFAAANMSAGHHNGVSAWNLYNTPFLVQMGEKDGAYGRNKAAANFATVLAKLRKEAGGGYVYDCFLHLNRGHGIVDRDPREGAQTVIADVAAWLKKGDRKTKKANTNAIAWVRRHVRNPWPERVVWDLRTRANRSGIKGDLKLWMTPNRGEQFYWLDLSRGSGAKLEGHMIDVRLDKKANAITVAKTTNRLRILLNGAMLDLSKPVTVNVGGKTFTVRPQPNLETMVRTLVDRGDPSYCFEAAITIEKTGDAWSVK